MNPETQNEVIRKLFLSIWAMVTLILLFCVILLANEMIRQGQDPLGLLQGDAPAETPTGPAPPPTPTTTGQREVQLYFGSEDGAALVSERRRLVLTEATAENCRIAIQELIAGPRDLHSAILPASAKVRAIYLLDSGELVVDLSRELLAEHSKFKSAALEGLMFYGIVDTVVQKGLVGEDGKSVKQVRFLIEGLPPQEAFPAHLDLSQPLSPDRRWIAAQADTPPDA
ncbi:MAG: GerMN domain-containing protein [Candidatus Hydrogenedentes bacterium]|nr:GerMN domain-containing protein [Candidatus Hydrogenedentota bacterium]